MLNRAPRTMYEVDGPPRTRIRRRDTLNVHQMIATKLLSWFKSLRFHLWKQRCSQGSTDRQNIFLGSRALKISWSVSGLFRGSQNYLGPYPVRFQNFVGPRLFCSADETSWSAQTNFSDRGSLDAPMKTNCVIKNGSSAIKKQLILP